MEEYMHIERLNSNEVNGILNGTVHVFSKIDGSSGRIAFEDGKLRFGSRKRILDLTQDNNGFMATMLSFYKDRLEALFAKYDVVLYCEWLKKHSIQYYLPTAWNKPYIYDVWDINKYRWMSYEDYVPILEEFGLEHIPLIGKFDKFGNDELEYCLKNANFLLPEDKFGMGEGICIKSYQYVNPYGRTTWAKVVQVEFQEIAKRDKKHKDTEIKDYKSEHELVDEIFTDVLIVKEIWKVINDKGNGEFSNQIMGPILNETYAEIIKEEFDEINTEMYIGIDIKKVKSLAYNKIKRTLNEKILKQI